MIEQHGRILLDRNQILSEQTSDDGETIFNGILEASWAGRSTLIGIGSLAVRVLKKTNYTPEIIWREKIALEMTETRENIVDLVAVEEDDKYHYIAYRQCFTSLTKLLKRHDWKIIEAQENFCLENILLDAARAVWQLHNNSTQFGPSKFIHENIRPQNILIYDGSERYVAKLSNLLMSKPIQMDSSVKSVSREFSPDVCFS